MAVSAGSRLGTFEVLELLGAGGMGEVYRARDTVLKRDVAIKVLPDSYSLDPDRLRRFQVEAQATAALNHPNILCIFHIGQHNGSPYIVTELLEGETLRDRLRRGAMPLRQALDFAIDVARGLAAAHEKGIIHRDLKPENLFVIKDGRAKILDFGLAKLTPARLPGIDGQTLWSQEPTRQLEILGTVGYMSPEQVRGQPADSRSDIFAFGAVLYEMLTGARAFAGDTFADTLTAILHNDPPWLFAANRTYPPVLAHIVRRCLEKSPEHRFQSAHDLSYALEAVSVTPDWTPPPVESRPRHSGKRISLGWAASVAVCIIITLLYPWVAPEIEKLARLYQLQRLSALPLTTLPGNVASPAFSPDGSQIAFAWDGENNGAGFDLYVKAIGSENPLRLTHHPATRLSTAWSPDGRNIAISRIAGSEDSGIYLVPPTGGPERKLCFRSRLSWFGNELSWSPDGKYLAFIEHPADSSSDLNLGLYLLSLDTLKATPVVTGCPVNVVPSFSPKGDLLAWACPDNSGLASLRLLRLHDGSVTQLMKPRTVIEGIGWSGDGRHIAFSGPWNVGYIAEISLARPEDSLRIPVAHDATDIAISPSGHRLAYVKGATNINIWQLDLRASPPKARKLVASTGRQIPFSFSPDGRRIAFASDRSGFNEVWVCDADGSNATQLTSFGRDSGSPRWSPDGKLIAFDSRMGVESDLYTVDANGGAPARIEMDILRHNTLPSWSSNGKWIYFNSGADANGQSIWKVNWQGGHALPIASNPALCPIESPSGEYVYFARRKKLWRTRADGSAPEPVAGMPEIKFLGDEWFPTGSGIYFMSHAGDKTAIKFFDLKSEKVSLVYSLEKSPPVWVGGIPVSNNGRWLLFPQVDEKSSNLMMIDNWQ
ncbi:MAG: PD40 domain-containing protein [Acidobacteriaceae bacterium]|nr:PD40 domain-containing protein [Acidobacteriaceae bacterium]